MPICPIFFLPRGHSNPPTEDVLFVQDLSLVVEKIAEHDPLPELGFRV